LTRDNYEDGSTAVEIFHYHKDYPLHAYRPRLPSLPEEEADDSTHPKISGTRTAIMMGAKYLIPHMLERLGEAMWDGVHHLESLLASSHPATTTSEIQVFGEEIDFEELMEYAMDEFEAF
jgi:hypothetical protein